MFSEKYNIEFPSEIMNRTINRLTNQIWKLIPMRENEENWKGQLDKVLTELVGLNEILNFNDKYLNLLANLEGLKIMELEFTDYRSKIFESITLLRESYKDANK